MKRAPEAVLLGAVVLVAAGCAGSSNHPPASRQAHALPATVHYLPEGVTLYAAPRGYRPAVSRIEVLDFYGRRMTAGPKLTRKPSVQLRIVDQGYAKRSTRDYPGWVLTFHDTKPISYGPASVPQKAGCAWVSIFDLRTRAWTEDFQNCPSRPALDPGARRPPSLRTDLRLTRHVSCGAGYHHLVGPKALSRFDAVTALLCTDGLRTYPGHGQWEVLVRKVAVSGVRASQRYFEQPNQPNLPKNGACTTNLIVLAVPVFVDGHGRAIRPRTPVDGCGHPLSLPRGEKPMPVHWHVVWVHRINQLISAAARAAHCPMEMGNTAAWAGPPRDSSGGPLFDVAPWKARICIYRTPPGNFAVGRFVRGFRLDVSQTRRLVRALAGPGPRRGCPKQRMFAEVGGSVGNAATVELGGCYRVERPDRTAGTAKPAVVRAILGVR